MPLPALFDPIVNAPKPQKIALGAVGLAIIGAAAYFLLLSPLQIKVDQLRTQTRRCSASSSRAGRSPPNSRASSVRSPSSR